MFLAMNEGVPKLVPIKRVDVFRSVLEQLKGMIQGDMQPGDRLPSDRDLAQSLGVSRPIVRQALKVLEGLGLVATKHGSGTYVTEPLMIAAEQLLHGVPPEDRTFEMLTPVRRAIETEIIRLAFLNRNETNIELLEETLRSTAPAASGSGRTTAGLDLSFEKCLGRICGNPLLQHLQEAVHELWLQMEVSLGVVPDNRDVLHAEHAQILERYRAGDLEGMIEAYVNHLSFSY